MTRYGQQCEVALRRRQPVGGPAGFDLAMRAVPPTGGDLVSLTWAGSGGAVLARTAGGLSSPTAAKTT